MPRHWVKPTWFRYGLAVVAVACGLAVRWLLDPALGDGTPLLVLVAPLILVGYFAGAGPTILAAVISAILGNYLFVEPRYSLQIAELDDQVRMLLFLGVAALIAFLSGTIYNWRGRIELEQERLRAILEVLPVGVYLSDANGRIINANAAAEDIWGRRRLSSSVEDYGKDYVAYWRATGQRVESRDWALARALATGQPVLADELEVESASGERRIILNYATPVRDTTGKTIGGVAVNVDITDRTRAEQMLRDSEARFRGTFENVAVGMTHTDAEGRYLMANETLHRMLGYSSEELKGRTFREITHPDDVGVDDEQYRRLFRGEISSFSLQKRYLRKDGSIIWVSLTRSIQPSAGGRPAYAINVVQDISASKAAEEALRSAHQRVVDTLNSITDGFMLLDSHYTVIELNPAGQKILGKTREQVVGWNVWDVFPDAKAQRFGVEFHNAMSTGQAVAFEEYYPSMGIWFDIRVYPTPNGLAVYFQDVTERRKDQEALRLATREARERALEAEEGRRILQAMMDHVPMGLIVADTSGGVRLSSRYPAAWAAVTRVETRVDTMRNDADWAAYRPGSTDMVRRSELPLARAIRNGEIVHGEEWVLRKRDGASVTILANAAPIRNEQGEIIGGVVGWQDITQVKAAQEAAAEANRAKDHFLAVLSHELRTPLTPVIAAAGMLQEDTRLPEDARQDMQMIRRNVELEKRLIDDLLDLTRISRGKLEMHFRPVDVGTVLRRAVEICEPDIVAKGLHLMLDLPETSHMVMADEARLQQVFWNLIHNAMKFTQSGGRITVRCGSDSADHVVGEVTDTGVGIEPKAIARIFDAFEQQDRDVTRQFGGLGLGLAICKAIVTQHEGHIRARSAGRGMGATFIVELPRLDAVPIPDREEAPKPAQGPVKGAAKVRILLVEDHADTARILARLFKRQGYEVEVAGDVASALSAAESRDFDLLVSDLGLPDGSGLDLMRRLRERHGSLRGIAISGYGQQADIAQSREAGFMEHVTKPVDIEQLTAAVSRVATR